jgi:DNA-binding NarL/FixJ family response regulator
MKPNEVPTVSVLVVDDSEVVRSRLCALLAESPRIAVAAEASDAREALRQFEAVRPDAVVLDYLLPDATGVDVLRQMKQSAPWCIVILLTAFRESILKETCLACGADYFFHKATQFERVPEVLERLASELQTRDRPRRGAKAAGESHGAVDCHESPQTPRSLDTQ